MHDIIMFILLLFLVFCAIAVSFSKNLLNSVIIFMSYSTVMAILWILLESPDLAITEAAVGAGITSVLFFVTLKKINVIDKMVKKEQPVTLIALWLHDTPESKGLAPVEVLAGEKPLAMLLYVVPSIFTSSSVYTNAIL